MAAEHVSAADGAPERRASERETLASLRAERDAARARAAEAEQIAEDLAEALAQARADLTQARTALEEGEHLALFREPQEHSEPTLGADGSDRGVLPMALTGVAVVCAMIAILSWANSGLSALFTLFMLAVAAGFAWAAWQTRIVVVNVEMVRGVVHVSIGEATHRFDLRNPNTLIEVRGRPDDADWQVRFLRRALDPITIDRSVVYPPTFMKQLREFRPDL